MLHLDDDIKELFLAEVKRILLNGKQRKVEKKRTTTKHSFAVNRDGSLRLIGKEVTTVADETKHDDGIPSQILQLVVESLSLENALKILEKSGYEVFDPSQVGTQNEDKGISENTLNLIAAQVLGIDEENGNIN